MYAFYMEELIWTHVNNEKTIEKIKNNLILLQIYNNLTIGVNVTRLEAFNDIAEYLVTLTDEQAMKITYEDVIKAVGYYEDSFGYLV